MLLSRADTPAWLDAGLALGAGGPVEARAALLALADDRPGLPPPGFVADLLALAAGARLGRRALPAWSAPLAAVIARYEDRLLAPLAGDPQLLACGDALARLPAAARPSGGALLASLLLDRAGVTGVEVDVAALRREIRAEPTPGALAALAAGYTELVTRAHLRPARWVRASDAGLIAAAPSLRRLGARLRLRALVDVADTLADLPWPRPRRRPRAGSSDSPAPGDLAVGGYTDVIPGSRLDGLVASELLFLGDPELFLPRLAEGSLLAYQRDEGLRRHPRYDLLVRLDPASPLPAVAAAYRALAGRRLAVRVALEGEHPDLELAETLFRALAPAGPLLAFGAPEPLSRAVRIVVHELPVEPRRALAHILEMLAW